MKKKNSFIKRYLELIIVITLTAFAVIGAITPLLVSMTLVLELNKSPYLFLINLIYIPIIALGVMLWNDLPEE